MPVPQKLRMCLAASALLFVVANARVTRITTEDLANRLSSSGVSELRLLDLRSPYERQTDGFVEGSEMVNATALFRGDKYGKQFRPSKEDYRSVVLLTSAGRVAVRRSERLLRSLGHSDFHCHVGSIAGIPKSMIKYPKVIGFEALRDMVGDSRVLLIDVRNRTELNEVGQIPGSVCLPLHEVEAAFRDLEAEEFKERYGFDRPSAERKDVVLTCRSGRRIRVADRILKRLGYGNLRLYSGSFKDWVRRGGETFLAGYDLDYNILS